MVSKIGVGFSAQLLLRVSYKGKSRGFNFAIHVDHVLLEQVFTTEHDVKIVICAEHKPVAIKFHGGSTILRRKVKSVVPI